MERTEQIQKIAELLDVSVEDLTDEIDAYGPSAIGGHIHSGITVDAHRGIHEATGMTVRQYESINVCANDYGFCDLADADMLDPEQVETWINWCDRMAAALGRIEELPYDERVEEDWPSAMLDDMEWDALPDYWEGRAKRLEELRGAEAVDA